MKKLLGLFMITVLTLVGCSQSEEKQDVVKIALCSDVAGISDKSFSQLHGKVFNNLQKNMRKFRFNMQLPQTLAQQN